MNIEGGGKWVFCRRELQEKVSPEKRAIQRAVHRNARLFLVSRSFKCHRNSSLPRCEEMSRRGRPTKESDIG